MICKALYNNLIVCSPAQAQARQDFWQLSVPARVAVSILTGLAGAATFWAAGVGGVALFRCLVNRLKPVTENKRNSRMEGIQQQRFSAHLDLQPHTPTGSPRSSLQLNPQLGTSRSNLLLDTSRTKLQPHTPTGSPRPNNDPSKGAHVSDIEEDISIESLHEEPKETKPVETKESLFAKLDTLETKNFAINGLTKMVQKPDQLQNFTGIIHVDEMNTISLKEILTILRSSVNDIEGFRPACITINLRHTHTLKAEDFEALNALIDYEDCAKVIILKDMTELDLTKMGCTSEQADEFSNLLRELHCPDLKSFKADKVPENFWNVFVTLLKSPILTADVLKTIPDDSLAFMVKYVKTFGSRELFDRFETELNRRLEEKTILLKLGLETDDPEALNMMPQIEELQEHLQFLKKID